MITPPKHINYPEKTMFGFVEDMGREHPKLPAYEFFNKKTNYKTFVDKILTAARAFTAQGIGLGDRVTICMPNVPQALVCFYALDRIGAVANMIHPLSARDEIVFYLNISKSKMILTVDMFCDKVEEAIELADHSVTLLVARMQEELPFPLNIGYEVKEGRKYKTFPRKNNLDQIAWKDFLKHGTDNVKLPEVPFDKNRTAVILYSGGTSGTPKGICLSDWNMNATALQARWTVLPDRELAGLSMLSCMPCFHGFGLALNLHLILGHGGCCILMPTFNLKNYAEMLIKKHPNFIAGVPTIFEALTHLDTLDNLKMDFLMGVFCGGDSLSVELKKKVDAFLADHGATVQVREGYGLTECVTASCLTPADTYKENSIGVAFPDTDYAIVQPGTDEVLPYGEEGEIILTGPSLMLGYLDNPEETANTLRVLPDGRTWLYTGDLGSMDEDGFVYFKQRIKRMIITNGYNVYPGQVENAIDSCPEVSYSCVIGVDDEKRMKRVKAYIVLRDGFTGDDEMKDRIMKQLKKQVARYALPREIVFRDELPKTLVGKVAYRKLEEENL